MSVLRKSQPRRWKFMKGFESESKQLVFNRVGEES